MLTAGAVEGTGSSFSAEMADVTFAHKLTYGAVRWVGSPADTEEQTAASAAYQCLWTYYFIIVAKSPHLRHITATIPGVPHRTGYSVPAGSR
jgi:hypothetical protein